MFVKVFPKWENQIRLGPVERVAQNKWGETDFAPSPRPPEPQKALETAPTATVSGYTEPVPMDLRPGKRRMFKEERTKSFTDGRCLNCSGFNDWAVECSARSKAPAFKAAGGKVKQVETKGCSEKPGKD